MNPIALTLRAAARQINAQADAIEAQGVTVTSDRPILIQWGADFVTLEEAERRRLEEIATSQRPHAWRDAGPGVPITMVGDNDDSVEMDDLLRAFGPFMTLAENANFNKPEPVVKDSTGAPFHRITIKRRAGLGRQAIRTLRDEIRGVWYSPWGQETRAHPLNVNHIPKPEVVHALFDKVY